MGRYVSVPTEIEAVQWDGTMDSYEAICALGARVSRNEHLPTHLKLWAGVDGVQGPVDVPQGHWVAKAAGNDYYPIEDAYFQKKYRPVVDFKLQELLDETP